MADSKVKVREIRIENVVDGILLLGEMYAKPNVPFQVLAADNSGILHFGTIEKVLHQHDDGRIVRDLVVRVNGGFLFDGDVVGLYIAQIEQYKS